MLLQLLQPLSNDGVNNRANYKYWLRAVQCHCAKFLQRDLQREFLRLHSLEPRKTQFNSFSSILLFSKFVPDYSIIPFLQQTSLQILRKWKN